MPVIDEVRGVPDEVGQLPCGKVAREPRTWHDVWPIRAREVREWVVLLGVLAPRRVLVGRFRHSFHVRPPSHAGCSELRAERLAGEGDFGRVFGLALRGPGDEC